MPTPPSTTPPTLEEQMAAQARLRAQMASAPAKDGKGAVTGCLIALAIVLGTLALIIGAVGIVGGWLYLL